MKKFKLIVCRDYRQLSLKAAEFVFSEMEKNLPGKYVLGQYTGNTPVGFRKELLKTFKQKKPCLKNFYLFNLDEYWPIKQSDPHSYFQEMKKNLWEPLERLNLGFSQGNAFIPSGEAKDSKKESEEYEKLLKKLGGVDLQMMGIGLEGHIGFNEKGSSCFSRTRLVDLSESTIRANSRFFPKKAEVPRKAITMGIATILEAKKILLMANGRQKKSIIRKFLQSKPTKDLPASFLKLHKDVTIMIDKEAYGKNS